MSQALEVPTAAALAVTVAEAASLLRLSRSQMYALLQRGELKSVKIGNSRRIPLSVLREYLDKLLDEEHEQQAGAS